MLTASLSFGGCSTALKGNSNPQYATQDWDHSVSSAHIANDMLRFDDNRQVSMIPLTRALVEAGAAESKEPWSERDLRELVERRTCFLVSISGETQDSVQIQNWEGKLVDASGRAQNLTPFPAKGFWSRKKVIPTSKYYSFAKDSTVCSKRKANLAGKLKVTFKNLDEKSSLSFFWDFSPRK